MYNKKEAGMPLPFVIIRLVIEIGSIADYSCS